MMINLTKHYPTIKIMLGETAVRTRSINLLFQNVEKKFFSSLCPTEKGRASMNSFCFNDQYSFIQQESQSLSNSSQKYFGNIKNLSITKKKPIKVVITGASGNIGYAIIFRIARGELFGKDQPISLSLVDIPKQMQKMIGIQMELEDCSFNALHSIECHSKLSDGFKNADYIILTGSIPMPQNCDAASFRTQYLQDNAKIFQEQAIEIDSNASKNCRILVVSNPCNSLAYVTASWLTTIPKSNVTALSRLDHNRSVSWLAKRFNVENKDVKKLAIWGNHSSTMFPDISYCEIFNKSVNQLITPKENEEEFIPTIKNRAVEIIKQTQNTSIASAGNASIDHIKNWAQGSKEEWVSMAVESDGSYNVPKGLYYSFPCICSNGQYSIVKNLPLTKYQENKMKISTDELEVEKKLLKKFLYNIE